MKRESQFTLVLTALAVLGAAVLAVSTRLGPGVGGDATIYITSAKNLVNGTGLGIVDAAGQFRLLPYFPPFFPLVLAFFTWLGADPESSALWLNILLFALTIGLTGLLLLRAGAGNTLSILGAALVAVSPVLIPAYSWAMAEPLAIWLGFLCLGLVLACLEHPQSVVLPVAAGLAGGLSLLTRYSMAAFLAAGAVGLLLLMRAGWRTRLARAGVFLLAGVLPVMLWIGYDLSQTTTVSSRSIESSAGMLARLASFWPLMREVLLFWLVPDSWISSPPYPALLNRVLAAGMVLVFFAALGWLIRKGLRKHGDASQRPLFWLAVLVFLAALAYTVLVGVVYFTTYPPITIGTRMFSPLHLAVIILLAAVAGLAREGPGKYSKMAVILVVGLGLLAVWWGWRSARIVIQNSQEGMGFNSVAWQRSETIRALEELPASTPLVTNEEMAVYYLTGRSAYPLAEIYADRPLDTFWRYGDGETAADAAQKVFRQQGAALVLFDSITAQLEGLYGPRTEERIQALTGGLQVVFSGEDGGIYRYPQP